MCAGGPKTKNSMLVFTVGTAVIVTASHCNEFYLILLVREKATCFVHVRVIIDLEAVRPR